MKPFVKKSLLALTVVTLLLGALYVFAPAFILKAMTQVSLTMGGFKKESAGSAGEKYYYYDNHRPDAPVIVALHGFSDRKESWFPFLNAFSKDYRVIVPDLAGHGQNPRDTAGDYSFAGQAAYLDELVTAIGIEKFHLVGISMGGGIAGKYAATRPERLHSVTFISPAGINDCPHASEVDQLMEGIPDEASKKAAFPLLPEELTRQTADRFKQYLFIEKIFAPYRLFRVYLEHLIDDREFYFDVLDDFIDIESGGFTDALNDELAGIDLPVCVIWGKQDPLLDASCARVFAENLPQPPTMTLIDDCGHATIAEQPKATRQAMREFLDGVGTGGQAFGRSGVQ